MVFKETLRALEQEVREAVDELFDTAFKNQRVNTDLLLILIHGFYDEKHLEFIKREKLSPYVYGPGPIGFSLDAFYDFFHAYRMNVMSKKKFQKLLDDPEKKEDAAHTEQININVELAIYLKFWESDMLLRELYNLVNLASGKYYDWNIVPPDLDKDKKNGAGKFSRRPFIRNHIQAPMEDICPKFYKLVKENYSAQIRNAVAHSKYYFMGRNLQLANRDENAFYELGNIPFDEWETRFHKTLLFYNFIIGNKQRYDKFYQDEVKDKHFGLAISTPRLTSNGLRQNHWVKYDHVWHRWLGSHQIED
jgi:hypothetical protein